MILQFWALVSHRILTVQLHSEQNSSSRKSNFGGKLHIWDRERMKYSPIFIFTWQILNAFRKLELEDNVANSSYGCVEPYIEPVYSSWCLMWTCKSQQLLYNWGWFSNTAWEVGWQANSETFLFFKSVVQLPLFVSPSSLIIVGNLTFEAFEFGNALYEKPQYKNKYFDF